MLLFFFFFLCGCNYVVRMHIEISKLPPQECANVIKSKRCHQNKHKKVIISDLNLTYDSICRDLSFQNATRSYH